ncbi:MAG: hypothetical protein Q8L74_01825 [Nitrospirota bacterium]|nr:hypothetical protein [Nitrospirota bacterium]MDP2383320.1 hypothetical protein [Nitrospirota bacterium]MDP3597258.1 hypothetical protein [Nitrospirota bacterium]
MPLPPVPFFMDGPCHDLGYLNTRDHPRGADHKRFVEDLWGRYYPLADIHFREDARNHFLQRFWEMYLAVALLEHGFELHRHGDEGPEFYSYLGRERVWFEAVAPDSGNGPDQVPQLVFGEATNVPTEQILLRFTNALSEKRKKYTAALAKGIVSAEDHYVLAINSRGIRHAPYGNSIPYFIQAFLPFGPLTISIDVKTFEQKDSFYAYRPEVSKSNGSPVSTRTFLDEESSFCSAVLHSGVDCANHPEQLGGDFSVLHNPRARCPLDVTVLGRCEQFSLQDNQLHRSNPSQAFGSDTR